VKNIVTPFEWSQFLSDAFHRRPFFVRRDNPTFYAELFSQEDLDRLFQIATPDVSRIVISRKVGSEGQSFTLTTKANPGLRNVYNDGYTISIVDVDRYFPKLDSLRREFEQYFKQPISCDMFITPPHAQGFPPHWDGQDIFAMQVLGAKTWAFYAPRVDTPLSESKALDMTGVPEESVYHLEQGDFLYFPCGWIHQAATYSGKHSAHLTFWLREDRWFHVLMEALIIEASRNARLRKAVPFYSVDTPSDLVDRLEKLAGEFISNADWAKALAATQKKLSQV